MLFTNHLLAGALIGGAVRRPAAAFVLGVASHAAMDVVPHWGNVPPDRFLRVARADGSAALVAAAGALLAAPSRVRPAVAAGMAGAGLLDLDKPCREFFGRSPFPAAVDAWHVRLQREAPHRLPRELAAASALAAAVLVAGSGRRASP